MARDDDDAISEEPPPKRRTDIDEDDEDRPRRKRSRDEDNDNDERPSRRKSARDDDEDSAGKKPKPMPFRLVMAIIGSMAWGGFMLHANCVGSSHSLLGIIHLHRQERDLRDFAAFANLGFGFSKGFAYTLAAEHFFMMLMAAALLAGGVALLMRMGFGKYLAMGAPAAMVLVELITFVICLIITSGSFLTAYNASFLINIVFSAVIAGCNTFMLLDKDVAKALR
jgi:hypothetical protein